MNEIKDLGHADVLIIGGGLGAMHAALAMAGDNLNIVIISKKPLGRSGASVVSNSVHRYSPNEDGQKEKHIKKIMEGGRYINDESLVARLVNEGASKVDILEDLSPYVSFKEVIIDGRPYRNFASCNPRDGKYLTRPMAEKVKKLAHVKVLEGYMAVDLAVADSQLFGAFMEKDNDLFFIKAKAVVLATGGASWLFSQTSGTNDLTGDGYAMAKRAGLSLMDMEFMQFYPYRICRPAIHDIFPETFKHGAILVNEKGERFMEGFPKKELENRDILSREMYRQKKVFLDLKDIDLAFLRTEGGGLYDIYLKYPDELYEVKPVAHFTMGGIPIMPDGSTQIRGLFCCGEVVGGLHGANRLAGQALTETVVFGQIAGNAAAKFVKDRKAGLGPIKPSKPNCWPRLGEEGVWDIRRELRALMWDKVGIVRTSSSLEEAMTTLETLSMDLEEVKPARIRDWVEVMNMIEVARSIVESCQARKESRGSHYREDFATEREEGLGNVYSNKEETVLIKK